MANATSTELQELYVAYFGRAADPTGLDYWTEKGITTAAFAADMYAQAEFKDAYGSKSVETQVNQIYKNLFDREADTTGLTYWTQQINLGVLKVAEIATHLIWAAKNNSGSSDDKTALEYRTSAAIAYTAEVKSTTAGILAYQAESTSPWVSGVNITEAVSYLSGIDKDTAHTAAGVTASVNTIVTNGDPATAALAKSINLTTDTDTGAAFTGTAANDTFKADNTGAAEVTSVADTLDGGAGTADRFHIYSDGTIAAIPELKNIEILSIYDEDTDYSIADISSAVTTANFIRGDGTVTFTVPATVTTVGLENIALAGAGVVIAAATADTEITLSLNKITTAAGGTDEDVALTGTGLKTVNINTTGTASSIDDIDVAAATTANINAVAGVALTLGELVTTGTKATINITGAGAVSLGTLDDGWTTVAGGTATGNISLTGPGTNNQDAVITLGSGHDSFTTGFGGFATTKKFAVDAGTGEDTLLVADIAHINTTDEGGRYTNFDIFKTEAANANLDMQYLNSSIDAAVLSDVGLTNLTAAMAGDITIYNDNAGQTFSLKTATGSSDVLTIKSAHNTSTTSADLTTTTITGFETLNFAANSGDALTTTTADRTTVSFTAAGDLTTINLTGTKSGAVDISSNAVKVTTLDASGITGGAVLTTGGQTGALTVTGSAVADTITIGTVGTDGSVTVNGGAGIDTFTATQAQAAAATIDGQAGVDVLKITDASTTTNSTTFDDATLNGISGIETINFSGAIAGDLTYTLGGFANTLATAISDNQLKITATALVLGAAADDITIDASQLTGSNSVELDIKDTAASTNASNITLTGSDNADTITVEEAYAASDNIIAVTGGKGNDTITVKSSSTHDGTLSVTAGDGDDTIDLTAATSDALTGSEITGGKGNDTIKLDTEGAATDFDLIFASTAANNGVDAITNMTLGATGDHLNVDAFLNPTAFNTTVYTANVGSSTAVTSDVNVLVDISGGQDITTNAGLTAALASGGEYSDFDMAGSGKAVFITAATNNSSETLHLFYASSSAAGVITATKVATIAGVDIDSFAAHNITM